MILEKEVAAEIEFLGEELVSEGDGGLEGESSKKIKKQNSGREQRKRKKARWVLLKSSFAACFSSSMTLSFSFILLKE